MRLALAVIIVMLNWPAMAEITLGKFKTIEARFGVIGVTWRPEGQGFVSWNGQPLPGLETREITIAGGYALEGEQCGCRSQGNQDIGRKTRGGLRL